MSESDPQGYYSRLRLNSTATADEIKAAYRRLAKELHPDTNQSSDAITRFQALNEAYQTVGDSEKRAAYDKSRKPAPEQPPAEPRLDPVCCTGCGKVTAQPRYTVFCYVVSYIVATKRIPIEGIFCAVCARNAAFKASLISAVAGWWSFPWGPIVTVGQIARNALGGIRPPGSEHRLLWHNARAFASWGNLPLAHALARQLCSVADDEIAVKAARLIDELKIAGLQPNSALLKNPWQTKLSRLVTHAVLACLLPLVLIAGVYQNEIGALWTAYNPGVARSAEIQPSRVVNTATPPSTNPVVSGLTRPGIPRFKGEPLDRNAGEIALCATPVAGGTVFGGYAATFRQQAHKLTIENGSGGNAIVKVRDAASGRLVISFFVEKNGIASFGNLPDGIYRMQYAFGNKIAADCRSFAVASGAGQFPDAETFKTTTTSTQITHSHLTYTLYAVASGNVRAEVISLADFDKE
jgi:hypothetical protein